MPSLSCRLVSRRAQGTTRVRHRGLSRCLLPWRGSPQAGAPARWGALPEYSKGTKPLPRELGSPAFQLTGQAVGHGRDSTRGDPSRHTRG